MSRSIAGARKRRPRIIIVTIISIIVIIGVLLLLWQVVPPKKARWASGLSDPTPSAKPRNVYICKQGNERGAVGSKNPPAY